ncbi:hypothetical protein [Streptomyces sp. NPDC057909]|uniref:hypothetical protein n=1 Tax=Streptomyces sp. NPDC057909 TaxID=3346277 RepID=UPI0036E28431
MIALDVATQLAAGCTVPILLTLLGVVLVIAGVWIIVTEHYQGGGYGQGPLGCCGGLLVAWVGVIVLVWNIFKRTRGFCG